jgi:hypothetical protein
MDERFAYSPDRTSRVVIYPNADGSFGFRDEVWSDEPTERCWVPRLWPDSHCDTVESAMREAAARIEWLRQFPFPYAD